MSDSIPEATLRDDNGALETVYIVANSRARDDGWVATSLDVGAWTPLTVGDRLVALDRESLAEFIVEVTDIEHATGEVFYALRYLAELDPEAEPALDSTRTWLT